MRRVLAGVALATFALSLAPASLAPGQGTGHDCAVPAGAGGAAVVAPSTHHHCGHSSHETCLATLGCVLAASAIVQAGLELAVPAGPRDAAPSGPPRISGRAALGPPTPPPNS